MLFQAIVNIIIVYYTLIIVLTISSTIPVVDKYRRLHIRVFYGPTADLNGFRYEEVPETRVGCWCSNVFFFLLTDIMIVVIGQLVSDLL
ncbi:hypothetical protein F5Y16DRAFT_258552 [Xylariaceae sp. FL0255]|nr:hypothetical protein F5Y16DRAFT_258552 [Xylariaceae sp. FL0255]